MTLSSFPESGSANFESTARTTFAEWVAAIEAKAASSHSHDAGSPAYVSIVTAEVDLGTGAQDGQFAICKSNSNRYVYETTGAKWRVLGGNVYGTVPASATYQIETGTSITLATGSTETLKTYDGTSWVNKAIEDSQTAKTASYELTAADLSKSNTFTNDGAGGEINFTWPTLSAGQKATFIVTDAQYLKITAPVGKTFRFLDSTSAATGYTRSNTVGNFVKCEATADDIVINNIGGTWNYDE